METTRGPSLAGTVVAFFQLDWPGEMVKIPEKLPRGMEPVSSPLKTSSALAVMQTRRVVPICFAPAKERMLEPAGKPVALDRAKCAPPSLDVTSPASVPT